MFTGSMVALVTPMHNDGSIDWDNLANLVEFHIDNGTEGIVAVGTTGESATLDEQEHCEVIAQIVEKVNGRISVIAGTGANSTTEAIRLSKCAKKSGADALLLVTPYYNKPTQEGLYLHYKAIAEAVDMPQFLYNVPGRTACDLLPETVGKLSQIKNIVGIKEATDKVERVALFKELCVNDFILLSGDDASYTEFLLLGGDGFISVTANIVPQQMRKICDAGRAKKQEETRALNSPLEALHQGLFCESSPIPAKWLLSDMGMIQNGIRLPMTVLSEKYHETLRNALRQIEI